MDPPSVTTAVRFRPAFMNEDCSVDLLAPHKLLWQQMGLPDAPCKADYVFNTVATQELVFDVTAKPLLDKIIKADGNVSIISCGQPGCGKSYTLFGAGGPAITDSSLSFGIYQRFATHIFSKYDATHFAGENPLITVKVTFYHINDQSHQIKDLVTNKIIPLQAGDIATAKTQLKHSKCVSAHQMISLLTYVLQTRPQEHSHTVVEVFLTQPLLSEGEFKKITSSVVFHDIGNVLIAHEEQWLKEDQLTLLSLATKYSGTTQEIELATPLAESLKSSFNGERSTLIFCCLSPSLRYSYISLEYIGLVSRITELRDRLVEGECVRGSQTDLQSSLLSEAESLFSKLSLTSSVTKEDHEKLRNWLTMKKECEDESLKSHGQLECIEEVTESEEEIASSNEKMSESPVSLDNSLSESDREEGDVKACQLSNNNFFSSLDIMCDQFNVFVDKFVDSFKAKTSLSPVKEHKRDYSATRRGGLPQQTMDHQLKADANLAPTPTPIPAEQIELVTLHTADSLMGCRRRTTQGSLGKVEEKSLRHRDHIERRTDEENTSHSSATTESRSQDKSERRAIKGMATSHLSWNMKNPEEVTSTSLSGLYTIFTKEEEKLIALKECWKTSMARTVNAPLKDRYLAANMEMEKIKNMVHGVFEFSNVVSRMIEILEEDCEGSKQYDYFGFNHFIRTHRLARQNFVIHKNNLDTQVKNKTARDEMIRDHIMADEMIETVDSCIELLNYMITNNQPVEPKVPNTAVGTDVLSRLRNLSSLEMRHLIFKYFMKVVDLRENSKQMENTITAGEQSLDWAATKIFSLQKTIVDMRGEMERLRNEVHTLRYGPTEEYEEQQGASSHLALAEGSKHKRMSGATKAPSIPQQNLSKLQATKSPPSGAKVTIKNNKLIIEKPNK